MEKSKDGMFVKENGIVYKVMEFGKNRNCNNCEARAHCEAGTLIFKFCTQVHAVRLRRFRGGQILKSDK